MKSSNLALRFEPPEGGVQDPNAGPSGAEASIVQAARRRIDPRPWFERRAIVIRDPQLPLFRVR